MSDEGNNKGLWKTLRKEGSGESEKNEKSDPEFNHQK